MAINQATITQAIAQAAVETVKVTVQALTVTVGESNSWIRSEPTSMGPKLGRSTLKQPTFDWGLTDTNMELKNFRLEVNSTFNEYNVNSTEKI